MCSHFLAGDALRSSSRYHALDETAVFGCACRHEFPWLFVNLKHGERSVQKNVIGLLWFNIHVQVLLCCVVT